MDTKQKEIVQKIAKTIRGLSIEAIEKAKSGHPGLPLGCAELGAYLYAEVLNHNPKNSNWINRDRFVLSAGHGSMLLYSALHLAGFKVSLKEIKFFRQLGSKTPGHPEVHITDGVEATTGPLGHGIGNAVGMAIGMKILKAKFNTDKHKLFENKIYTLAGDGCMMEGAVSEASAIAGHLRLDNLVIIYDANKISLDGPISESTSEDTRARYRAYGFDVFEIDGHDLDAIDATFREIKQKQEKPVLIMANTIIGKGSPHMAGSHKVHGSPLGQEEVLATKKAIDLPKDEFYVPNEVQSFFEEKLKEQKKLEDKWNEDFSSWAKENPKLFEEFKKMQNKTLMPDIEDVLRNIEIKTPIASRESSSVVLNYLADILPFIYSGSADLSSSDKTYLTNYELISFSNFKGRNFKFGVREFAMGTISNGLSLVDTFIPVCGTFLVFSDYMRNAIRLAALSNLQVIYHYTHDSIFLGEDGPTHQAVEQIASLRAIPNLQVIRPADSNEVKMAWLAALTYKGPTALILSRQKLTTLNETNISFEKGLSKGAYIVKEENKNNNKKIDFTFFATGSELEMAIKIADQLEKSHQKNVRVVSFPCFEIFEKQSKEYKDSILKGDIGKRVSIEAGSEMGWHKYIGIDGIAISVNTFGKSAPEARLREEFGFNIESILKRLI
ncbi:MAG: Transketolase [Candidatus Anoxychlamydiales bacterium]|nr:Transketolase [Candidatus Anoxychlamydiales bacterium]NGX36285.1 Transketolase [Candidatus Anoxychlamydiales bacterium]